MGQVCRDGIQGTACLDLSGISGVQIVLTLLELLELPRILAVASTLEGRGNGVISRCQHT